MTKKKMVAFHGDPKIKQKYLDRVAAHRKADELVQGKTWRDGKGCAVGCTLHAYKHKLYESELGIPEILARLEDRIFEGLQPSEAQEWPQRFLAAPKPGADLSLVGWKFLYWCVSNTLEKYGTDQARTGCSAALDVLRLKATGKPVASAAVSSAVSSAVSAAASAAVSSAYFEMSNKLEDLLREAQ